MRGQGDAQRALREMRSARRRRFVGQLDVMEVVYRVYVAAIFGAIALAVIAGAVNDANVSARAVEDIARTAPALLGLGVALAVLAGLRSGARGDRWRSRTPRSSTCCWRRSTAAWRCARRPCGSCGSALGGAVLGAVAGNFAFRRLPGSPVEWLACLALFGAAIPLCTLGCALLASGRRLRPVVAGSIGTVLLAWTLADVVLGTKTSPATMLGVLATLPLQSGTVALGSALGLAVAAAAGVAGLLAGRALARGRPPPGHPDRAAALLGLGAGPPRRRPPAPPARLREPAAAALGAAASPGRRAGRSGGAAGRASCAGRRRGWAASSPSASPPACSPPAPGAGRPRSLALAGVVLLVAALDLVEPLAQEVDHPLRRDLVPVRPGSLIRQHLVAPVAAMSVVALFGTLAAMALGLGGDRRRRRRRDDRPDRLRAALLRRPQRHQRSLRLPPRPAARLHADGAADRGRDRSPSPRRCWRRGRSPNVAAPRSARRRWSRRSCSASRRSWPPGWGSGWPGERW